MSGKLLLIYICNFQVLSDLLLIYICKLQGVDDAEEFTLTLKSLSDLKFSEESQRTIFDSLTAILKLGNVVFIADGDDGNSIIDRKSMKELGEAASLLGIDAGTLGSGLCVRIASVGATKSQLPPIPLNPTQSMDLKNAAVKAMYGRIFAHIIAGANEALSAKTSPNQVISF